MGGNCYYYKVLQLNGNRTHGNRNRVTYLIESVEEVAAVMLLVNLQLATTSTVDGFQPVIEVAETQTGET